jgi:transposase, IS30 family
MASPPTCGSSRSGGPRALRGDLIIGKHCRSAVDTLVERTTRYVLFFHLPHGRGAHSVAEALREVIAPF